MDPNAQTPQPQPEPQPQPTAPPTVNPVTPLSPAPSTVGSPAVKKIKNSGDSVFYLGIFLTIVLALVSLAVIAGHANTAHQTVRLIITGFEVLLGIGMIVNGRRLKSMTSDTPKAIAALNVSIGLCGGVLILSIIESALKKPIALPIQGLLALVAVIYLIVVRGQLKKLS